MNSVMIDSREPAWVQALKFGNVPTAVAQLETGDVWAAVDDGVLIIERKTPSDLLHTIKEGRLLPQVARMREMSPWCYVVITGQLLCGPDGKLWHGQQSTGWQFDAIQGALLTVQELGVAVLECNGDDDFERTVMHLAERERGPIRIHPPRAPYMVTPGEAILCALPGVGFERTTAVLAHCGTPAWAISLLTDPTTDAIPGIPAGHMAMVRNKTRKALGLTDTTYLAVLGLDDTSPEKAPF